MTKKLDTGLEELTEDRCWQLLASRSIGRLAVSINNRPDIFPVNYRIDDETIVVLTAPGLKLAAATLGVGVAFEVDELDELRRTGWSVVVHGTAGEIERLEDLMEADELRVEPWADGIKHRYIRIVPTKVTGRRVPGT